MNENHKSYYAIIPANIRYDERLTPNAKLLYGEITALCNEKGYCWANNLYFSELYNVSKTSISKWISQLKKYSYISIEMEYKNKEILKRYIRIVNGGIEEKLKTPIEEKLKDNITLFNNTMNNTYIDIFIHWNTKKIIIHKKEMIARNIKKKHKEIISLYGEMVVKQAIDNYAIVLESENYYWTHRWGLLDFLVRGIDKFVSEARPLENYLKRGCVKEKIKSPEDMNPCPECGLKETNGSICRECGYVFD